MFLLLPLPTLGYGRSDPSSSGAVAFDKDLKELAGAGGSFLTPIVAQF